jgi:hypothetical protein
MLALVPATAFADGAGDEQYQDPLAAPTAPKKPKKKAAAAPTSTTPAATTAPQAASPPSSATVAQTTASPARELPRTGLPAGLIGLAGITLIVSGAALRRRAASQ